MEPHVPPVDPQPLDGLLADVIAVEAGPVQLAASTAVNLGLMLLPLLVLLTAVLKLRRSPDNRALHSGLAIAAGLAVALSVLTVVAPRAIPDSLRITGVLSFTWIFLYAWMALDFTRSARRTGLRPRSSDIAVLLCVAVILVAFILLLLA